VIVYSRPGCHLCDEAKEAIKQAGCSDLYTLKEVDIESDAELQTRYKWDIPVITINGIEVFRHRVDSEEFKRAIKQKGSSSKY
jgi:glutaredoxin